jgi:type I restriction enzyme, S subunit
MNKKTFNTVNLGDVINVNPDSINTKNYQFKTIEYIDISSVGSNSLTGKTIYNLVEAPSRAKRVTSHGDTILATVRPNLRAFLYIKNPKPNLVVSTGFAVLRPSQNIDKQFLFYTVINQEFTDYLTINAKGAAYPAVDVDIIKRAKINLPPLPTQHKIASILSAYDDLIENNTRRIKILESMAQTLYQEWFVKFRFPGCEQVKMVESELGLIPEGWEVRNLKDVCNLVMGQSPKSEFYNEIGEGLPFHQGVSNFGAKFPTDKIYCTVLNRIAEAEDILFSVRAPVGRINIANKKIIIGRGLCAIRSNPGNQSFIFQQLKEKFSEEDLMGGGTIFKSVTKKDMEEIKLIISSTAILQKFESIVDPIFRNLELLINKNINLRKTRDLLLPKLISGQIAA